MTVCNFNMTNRFLLFKKYSKLVGKCQMKIAVKSWVNRITVMLGIGISCLSSVKLLTGTCQYENTANSTGL